MENMNMHNLSLGMAYVPMQKLDKRYSDEVAIIRGTLFPDLDLPFMDYVNKNKLPQSPLCDVMMYDFVCLDLRMFLDTHPDDCEAKKHYEQYVLKSKAAHEKYEKKVGPLISASICHQGDWIDNPWPWEE